MKAAHALGLMAQRNEHSGRWARGGFAVEIRDAALQTLVRIHGTERCAGKLRVGALCACSNVSVSVGSWTWCEVRESRGHGRGGRAWPTCICNVGLQRSG